MSVGGTQAGTGSGLPAALSSQPLAAQQQAGGAGQTAPMQGTQAPADGAGQQQQGAQIGTNPAWSIGSVVGPVMTIGGSGVAAASLGKAILSASPIMRPVAILGGLAAAAGGTWMTIKGGKASETAKINAQLQPQFQQIGAKLQELDAENQTLRAKGGGGNAQGATAAGGGGAPAGPWSVQSTIGSSIGVGSARVNIENVVGSPEGYATMEAARAQGRAGISTNTMGVGKRLWMVLEHGGRFYAVTGNQVTEGGAGPPLGPDRGRVVAWDALVRTPNPVTGASQWTALGSDMSGTTSRTLEPNETMAYPNAGAATASTSGGASAPGVAGMQERIARHDADSPTGAPTGAPTAVPRAPADVMAGGATPAPRVAFDPRAEIGRSFSMNATAAGNQIVEGGAIQIRGFARSSEGGFVTPDEAALLADQLRDGSRSDNPHDRWVVLQGDDSRYYVYLAEAVSRPTEQLQASVPGIVLGHGFNQGYDEARRGWVAYPG